MAGENLPIISNRKLDIKSYVPEYLKYKSNGDFYEFIGVFEEYLNTMYINKTNSDQETLGILEKIESLKTLQDAWDIDFDYINHFAKFLGFQININTDDFSINIFGKPFAELDSDEQETIKKHVRQFVKTLPSWYRIKSTKNSVRAMLYSFGLVSDIIEKYTLDYNSTGINWIDVPLDDVVTLPPGYYPTPHFGISIDVGNTSDIIETYIPGCIPHAEITINSFESNNIGIIDNSSIEKKNIGGLGSIDKFFGVAFRYTRNANNSYPTLIDVSDGTNKLLNVYQDQSVLYETIIEIIVNGSLKQFSTLTPFETLFPLGVEQTIHVSIDLTNPLAAPIMYLDGVEYNNGYDIVNNDSIASFPVSYYDLKSSSDGSELSDLYWSSNSDFALLSSVAKYAETPNTEEDNRPFYAGKELFTQVAPDVVPVFYDSFIGNGTDAYVDLSDSFTNDYKGLSMSVNVKITQVGNDVDIIGISRTNGDGLLYLSILADGTFLLLALRSPNTAAVTFASVPQQIAVGDEFNISFHYDNTNNGPESVLFYINGVRPQVRGSSLSYHDCNNFNPNKDEAVTLYLNADKMYVGRATNNTIYSQYYSDIEVYDVYWSNNINAIDEATIIQYADGEEHFTQVAPDVVPVASNYFIGDGVDSYIVLSDDDSINLGGVHVAFNFNVKTVNGGQYLNGTSSGGTFTTSISIRIMSDGRIRAIMDGSLRNFVYSSILVNDNQRHNVSIVATNDDIIIIVDDVSDTNLDVVSMGDLVSIYPVSDFYLGRFPTTTVDMFDGETSELYWSTNPLAVDKATIIQHATGQEHFTQVEPDALALTNGVASGVIIGGREYGTAVIGDLEWMTENLSYESGDYMYPDGDINNVSDYGLLYRYQTALNLVPEGWRLPTKDDFKGLISETAEPEYQSELDPDNFPNASKYLKDDILYWNTSANIVNNDLLFSARGAGAVWGQDKNNTSYISDPLKTLARFHTTTVASQGSGWRWICNINDGTGINFNSEWVEIENVNRRNFSVRYVRDTESSWLGGAVQGEIEEGWLGDAVQGEIKGGWLGGAVQGEIEFEEDTCIIEEVIITDSTLPTWYNNITRLTDIVSQVKPINTVFDGFVSKFSVVPDFTDDQKIQIRAKVFPYYGSYAILSYKTQYLLDEGFGPININTYYLSDAGVDNIYADLENYVAIDGQII